MAARRAAARPLAGRSLRANGSAPKPGALRALIAMRTLRLQSFLVFAAVAACSLWAPRSLAAPPVAAPTLRWQQADGSTVDAAASTLDVRYAVSGMVAEGVVIQRFRNDSAGFLEGQYLLPLPDGAAVHSLKLRIGQRVIEGEIRERERARAEYAAAAAAGQRASLVEQHQANLFRTAVANVAPGEEVSVEVGWWQRVDFQDGEFSLVFPLTFVPRYSLTEGTDVALDATPTVVAQSASNVVAAPSVDIAIALDPGLALASIHSDSHPVDVQHDGGRYDIALVGDRVPADRDFVLRWRPEAAKAPQAALFVEQTPDAAYALVMMVAPSAAAERLPRELVLVIDTSGSMLGRSLAQAKSAALAALARLTPQDRFNVIRFSTDTEPLFEHPTTASAQAVELAREWIAMLEADGGTEMLPALQAALVGQPPAGFVRQVVFATDGAVTDTEAMYTTLESTLGNARLFPIGIGDAPNAGFMQQAARMGRGAALVIRDGAEVEARMTQLFDKLDRPASSMIDLRWPGLADSYPTAMPDLYAGEPLIAVARIDRASGEVIASGTLKQAGWSQTLNLARKRSDHGIARLWAKSRVEALEDSLRRGADPDVVRAQIVEVALRHHLVTRHTSLVAIDRTPVRPADSPLDTTVVGNGSRDDSLAYAATATDAPLAALLGIAGLLLLIGALRMPRRERIDAR
jgi:Ca-activated chloride channel family protein